MGISLEDVFKGGAEGLLGGIGKIIGAFKADPTIMAQNAQKVLELEAGYQAAQLNADLQIQLAQARINEIEAGSQDKFVSRWRPFIGWVCASGLVYTFVGQPFLAWGSLNFHWIVPPTLDVDALMTLLFGMLGLGGMRTFEKAKGVAK